MALEIHRTETRGDHFTKVIESYLHDTANVMARMAWLLSAFEPCEVQQIGGMDWYHIERPGVSYDIQVIEVEYVN